MGGIAFGTGVVALASIPLPFPGWSLQERLMGLAAGLIFLSLGYRWRLKGRIV